MMKGRSLNKENTILFVMPRLPFPATSGRKTSLYHYCHILSEKLGYRLVVAAFLEEDDDPKKKPEFIDRLVILPSPSIKTKILNITWHSFIKKEWPMQVSLYWNAEAKQIVKDIFCEEKPAIVIGDMVRTTEYIRDLLAYRIADLDDRISLRYQRQLSISINDINPYGAYINTVPAVLRKLLLRPTIKTKVLNDEIVLLHDYELNIGNVCEKTILVAEKEVDEFNAEIRSDKAVNVPIGVDVDFFKARGAIEKKNIIGFLGAMNVAHNEYAAIHFIKDIFPIVLEKIPDAKFMVIGGGVNQQLKSLESDHIVFTGRVLDVRDYLEKCKVFVCPMTFGSGIKTKNLEAMAMGLPVVTTSIGAENIEAIDKIDWMVSDQNEDFASNIIQIINDDSLAREMGKNAAKYIREHWTWKEVESKFSKILGEALQ